MNKPTEEPTITIRPSWVLQTLIAVLLTVIGVMASSQYEALTTQYNSLQTEIVQLRGDFTALELGLREDRFTRTDARVLETEMKDYVDREIRRLKEEE